MWILENFRTDTDETSKFYWNGVIDKDLIIEMVFKELNLSEEYYDSYVKLLETLLDKILSYGATDSIELPGEELLVVTLLKIENGDWVEE